VSFRNFLFFRNDLAHQIHCVKAGQTGRSVKESAMSFVNINSPRPKSDQVQGSSAAIPAFRNSEKVPVSRETNVPLEISQRVSLWSNLFWPVVIFFGAIGFIAWWTGG